MPVFEFDEGSRAAFVGTNEATIDFVDDGVAFSWSVTSPDGSTSLVHEPGARFGAVRDFLEGKEVSGGTDEFKLISENNHFDGSVEDPVQLNFNKVEGQVTVTFKVFDSTDTVTQTLNGPGSVSAVGEFDEIIITTTGEFQIDSLSAEVNVNCFLEGTQIATPTGQTQIENLRPGDFVNLASGGHACVTWVARQTMYPRFQSDHEINPVCITAGALADGVPARDLYVTMDHGIALDGLLINAGALINDQTITQVARMPNAGFTYYHIETDAHALILAENVQSETFVDYAGRGSFDNLSEHPAPDRIISEMPLPRVTSARLLPAAIKARLDARAWDLRLDQAS
ncbi:MAG: Hint domain-containing protein [Pseudomonadota bacterium]